MRHNDRFNINQLFQNSKALTIIVSICITGLSAGIFFETCLMPEDQKQLSAPISAWLKAEDATFIPAFISNISLLLIIYLLSFTKYGKVLSPALLFVKTFALGFCSALLVNALNGSGILVLVLSLLPSNIIILIALSLAVYCCSSFDNKRNNAPMLLVPAGMILLASCIEIIMLRILNV